MTTPREEQPATAAAGAPTVSTAPPRSRWRFGAVPSHLGRARTSTVVLAVLFVLVAALWITVRPDPVVNGPTGGAVPVQQQPTIAPRAPARATSRTTPPTATTPPPTTPSATSSRTATGTGTSGTASATPTGILTPQPTEPSSAPSPPAVTTATGAPTS